MSTVGSIQGYSYNDYMFGYSEDENQRAKLDIVNQIFGLNLNSILLSGNKLSSVTSGSWQAMFLTDPPSTILCCILDLQTASPEAMFMLRAEKGVTMDMLVNKAIASFKASQDPIDPAVIRECRVMVSWDEKQGKSAPSFVEPDSV